MKDKEIEWVKSKLRSLVLCENLSRIQELLAHLKYCELEEKANNAAENNDFETYFNVNKQLDLDYGHQLTI